MAPKRYNGDANDLGASQYSPNDHDSNAKAAKEAIMAAAKAEKEAADRAAAEFKAKAAEDAQELEACRVEIRTLEGQLQEAQQLANTSSAENALASSSVHALQNELASKTNELNAAEAEMQNLTSDISNLQLQLSEMTASNDKLQSQLSQCIATCEDKDRELTRAVALRDQYANELRQRVSELDSEDVTIRQITWANRDLTGDQNIGSKVKERVRNGRGIPFSNDFFGCDPQPGARKSGVVKFCRSRKVEGWEYEEKSSMP
ncbi:hypothetical protein KCU67_g974, partial [Aureobasidium melanogenum]